MNSKSNFEFLSQNWPDLAELGRISEGYYNKDAIACILTLERMCEFIVQCIFKYEKLRLPSDTRQINLVSVLEQKNIIPKLIDDILFVVRKARNDTAITREDSEEKITVLFRLSFNLCVWFMKVYGDWDFMPDYLTEIDDKQEDDLNNTQNYEARLQRIIEHPQEVHNTSVVNLYTSIERRQQSDLVAKNLQLTNEERTYLLKGQIRIEHYVVPAVSYTLHQNKHALFRSLIIRNYSENDVLDAELVITSEPEFCSRFVRPIDVIPRQSSFDVKNVDISLDGKYLSNLSEQILSQVTISLISEGDVLYSETVELDVLTYDQWLGSSYCPELLASYITPNHPEVTKILAKAAEILDKWTGDPSIVGYNFDTERVLKQAAAIFNAIQEQNIIYAIHAGGFNKVGQRIRFCDGIMKQKMGNCIELSLLYCACLEAAGINSLLILVSGHAYAGFWLVDETMSEIVTDDDSLLRKRIASGVNEIALVECTLVTSGNTATFERATQLAEEHLLDPKMEFACVVDIKRARQSGIVPLSIISGSDNIDLDFDVRKTNPGENALEPVINKVNIDVTKELDKEIDMPKMQQWERKLLDLGMRNALINLRMTKTMIPLFTFSLDKLEDELSSGNKFTIYPKPDDWHINASDINFENIVNLGRFERLIQFEFINKRLRTTLTESELDRVTKLLYRSAKVSLEENGANTLYLTIGLIKWFESNTSKVPRYAPVIMLPVEMTRRVGSLGYSIRIRDEEPQINITMLEKMKQDFGIVINGLDPLPIDEHGMDIRKIFTILRQGIMNQRGWDIIESAFLGIFSFSQFVMWNDLKNRSDDLINNKVVKSLMDGKLSWEIENIEVGECVDEGDTILPIPVDASQLHAIDVAGKGESFVLHGPPGTGKSQTITALIANALAQDKTVLFVAEKMAALEVVQRRLCNILLGPFCLELHSNKATKRDILEQLRRVMEITKTQSPKQYEIKANQLAKQRLELDQYVSELHVKRSSGLSVYEMINNYETYSDYPDIPIPKDYDVTEAELIEINVLLDKMVVAATNIGHPLGHPLAPVKLTHYSQELRTEANECLSRYLVALNNVFAEAVSFADAFELKKIYSHKGIEHYKAIAVMLCKWNPLPRVWAKQSELTGYLNQVLMMCQHYDNAAKFYAKISINWNDSIINENASALKDELKQINSQIAPIRFFSMNSFVKRLSVYSKGEIDKLQLASALDDVIQYKAEKSAADALYLTHGEGLGQEAIDTEKVRQLVSYAKEVSSELENLTGSDEFRIMYAGISSYKVNADSIISALESFDSAKLNLDETLRFESVSDGDNWINEEIQAVTIAREHVNELRAWVIWNSLCEDAIGKGIQFVLDAYESGIRHNEIIGAYRKAVYRKLAIRAIDSSKILNTFSGAVFEKNVEIFKKLDKEMLDLAQKEIFNRLASKLPDFTREAAQNSELGILKKAIHSGGRGISIRQLFAQLPTLLPRLCPCMLMSPISVAQYLDPKKQPFDLVVFDEASQVPTCKAIGTLARGENAIIVGDPKQMPPTSFFATNTVDEDNIDFEDLESILDDCLAINMPQLHLLWHYRSRHESLIAYSNSYFYENKLFTFPSVNDRKSMVNFVYVDGVFDRGNTRQNILEAEAIVEEIKRRCYDEESSRYSVGIVTFNISQQNLIDDLIAEACVEDEKLERWVYETEEPLFIKNLENVQGDERDVILFSIGYGPNENGKVYMNFGPLNRDGGWRRLNVAISRARYEMKVFSSLTPEDIDLSRTNSYGVSTLKGFLEYASGKCLAVDENSARKTTSSEYGIINEICSVLKKEGYDSDCNIGHSEYRMDIGVVDPENPDEYILGIMLDGPHYASAKNARDREISQIAVLEGLGWNVVRVWSMEWWENRDHEISRILEAVAFAKTNKKKVTPDNTVQSTSKVTKKRDEHSVNLAFAAETTRKNKSHVIEYKAMDSLVIDVDSDEFLKSKFTKHIKKAANEILRVEAPLTEELLIKRIIQRFGFKRSGSRMNTHVAEVVHDVGFKFTVMKDQRIYWLEKQIPDEYKGFRAAGEDNGKRSITEVPYIEAINAIIYVLFENGNLPEDILIKETAKLLGYNRTISSFGDYFTNVIDIAIESEKIIRKDGNCVLNPNEMGSVKALRANFVID